jgi:hypothetical protein
MAISSGVAPHLAWLSVNGAMFPVQSGSAEQAATRSSSTFSAEIPLQYPGALDTLATLSDNTASVIVMSHGVTAPLVTGEIDSVDIKFIEGMISVHGRCKSAKLHEKKSSEKWVNKKTGQVVQDLASRAGLSVQADPGLLNAGKFVNIDWARVTDGISFASVIHKMAELDGARWWTDASGNLQYRYVNSPAGIYTLNYSPGPPISADFFTLTVKFNIQAAKQQKVTVKSWHPKQKKVNQGQASAGGSGGPVEYNYHIPNLTPEQAQQYAKSKAAEHARHAYTLNAHCVGDPSIDVAMALALSGTGYFDGQYQIDSVHHHFGNSGHDMEISAKTPGQGKSS